jgi:hypothetical protein
LRIAIGSMYELSSSIKIVMKGQERVFTYVETDEFPTIGIIDNRLNPMIWRNAEKGDTKGILVLLQTRSLKVEIC